MAITVQDIKDTYTRQKRDISDVDPDVFIEWVKFLVQFIFDELKGIDPDRFVASQSYSVVTPPQKELLPTDLQDVNQTSCGFYRYYTRKRSIVTFDETGDSGVTFSDSGGTSAYNTAIKVQGGASRGFTGDAEATLQLSWATNVNWNDFSDGGATSPNNDFISIWVYVGNTVPSSVTLEFSTNSNGSDVDTNEYQYQYTSLVAGWNRIKVAKSAFTATGSPSWDSLGYLRLTHTGGDTTTNVYYDKLELVESEVNGNDETDQKLGITGYGSKDEGYYFDGAYVVFTGADQPTDRDYVMRYTPFAPEITGLTDYITLDKSATGKPILENRHLRHTIPLLDVFYEFWDDDVGRESIADFRLVRAMGQLLGSYNRQPQIAMMKNPLSSY